MSGKEYVIRWRSHVTGEKGGGTIPFTKADAQEQIVDLNKRWPEIDHWIEKIGDG